MEYGRHNYATALCILRAYIICKRKGTFKTTHVSNLIKYHKEKCMLTKLLVIQIETCEKVCKVYKRCIQVQISPIKGIYGPNYVQFGLVI